MLRDELIGKIGEWNPSLDGTIQPDTPLISSARLDSMSLFQLLVWIEQTIGRPIDATAIDMASEWDTVDAIVAWVAREGKGR